jgi:hypothetical protein
MSVCLLICTWSYLMIRIKQLKLLQEVGLSNHQLLKCMLSSSLMTRFFRVCFFTFLLLSTYFLLYLCGVLYEPTGSILVLADEVTFYALCFTAFLLNLFLLRRWFILPDDEPNLHFIVSFIELLPAACLPEIKQIIQVAHGCRAPPISA